MVVPLLQGKDILNSIIDRPISRLYFYSSYPFDDHPNGNDFRSLYSKAPDDAIFRHLATLYASNHATMKTGHVCQGDRFEGGITNGAQWYKCIPLGLLLLQL